MILVLNGVNVYNVRQEATVTHMLINVHFSFSILFFTLSYLMTISCEGGERRLVVDRWTKN